MLHEILQNILYKIKYTKNSTKIITSSEYPSSCLQVLKNLNCMKLLYKTYLCVFYLFSSAFNSDLF